MAGLVGRRRVIIGVATGAVLVSTGGLAAAQWVKSPQQVAAEAEPPPKTTLTAQVEHRVLRDTVVLRGDIVPGISFDLTPTLRDASKPVVTAVKVEIGSQVEAGEVLLEVAGRPLVVLGGLIPAYRDLRPGLDGSDVKQLQQALKALGQNPGKIDGQFGAGTKRAVQDFYRKLGYEAPTTGEQDELELKAAANRVRDAERAVSDAGDELARAEESGEPEAIAAARKQLRYAEEDLAEAKMALADLDRRTGPMVPISEYAFLPSFPARVDSLTAKVGAEAQTPLITISSGELRATGALSPAQHGLLQPGMKVELASESLGLTGLGVVESIGDLPDEQAGGYPLIVAPEGVWDERLIGQNVRLTIEAASSDGEVLVVPITAIYATADGSATVIKQHADGREERVRVAVGVSGNGFVAVTPEQPSTLVAGDLVTVGAAG